MSHTLKRLKKTEIISIMPLYKSAFPLCERLPQFMLKSRMRRNIFETLAIMEEDEMKGFFISSVYQNYVLVFYFAIEEKYRGQGVGTKALRLLKEYYNAKDIFLEIEDPNVVCDNQAQRVKRLKFYTMNGFKDAGQSFVLYKTNMRLLYTHQNPNFDVYKKMLKIIYGFPFCHVIKPKM